MTSGEEVRIWQQEVGTGQTCRTILETLPEWFGIPASVEDYVATAQRSPSVIASRNGDDIGFLTMVRHSPYAAEVYVMGVRPEFHRRGIGWQLLSQAEQRLM